MNADRPKGGSGGSHVSAVVDDPAVETAATAINCISAYLEGVLD